MSVLTNSADDNDRTVVVPRLGAVCENALPTGTRIFEFEILRLVGEGGFGIVYLAHDEVLQRRVALKEYLPSSLASRGANLSVNVTSVRHEETFMIGLRSFLNEARLLAQFDHHALVKVYRFWEANGTAYMVMPYYEGATFKQAVQRDGPPNEAALKALLLQLLDALEVLHGADCVHRDVAPDNVLMLSSNQPVLLDFGASRRVITDHTQELTVILKPGYAPIEQYGEIAGLQQGPWTDLYALAGMAHFAIAGSPPPPAIVRTLTDPYVPLEQAAAGRYSEPFLRAIDRALAVRPNDRPQSAAQFRALLLNAQPQAALSGARKIAAPSSPRAKGPALAWVGGGIAFAIAVGAGLFFYNTEPVVAEAPRSTPAPIVLEPPLVKPSPSAELTPVPLQPEPNPAPAPVPVIPGPPPADTFAAASAPSKPVKPPAPPRAAKQQAAKLIARTEVSPPPPAPPAPTDSREASAAQQMAAMTAAALEDGEKCLRAKQYDCAIANANSALRVEPERQRARKLKADAEEGQRRALSQIKIE